MEIVSTIYGHLDYFTYIFYGQLVYCVVIWYITTVLVYCTKKNLATLTWS
jgi:hypothetical protein